MPRQQFVELFLEELEDRSLMSVVPLAELTEGNASAWKGFAADNRPTTITNSTAKVVDGRSAIRFDTRSGFDTGMKLAAPLGGWNVSGFKELTFWTNAVNGTPYGFQGAQPVVVLVTTTGTVRYTPTSLVEMPNNGAAWHRVTLAGNAAWKKTTTGTPDLKHVTRLEIHQDTWDYGFSVTYDAMRFKGTAAPPVTAPKVLLYIFDPIMENHGGQRLHEVYGWGDPVQLAKSLASDLAKASHGAYQIQIVQTKIVDAEPYFTDGFQHTDASFDAAWARGDFHIRAMFDYQRFIRENNLAARIDAKQLDEVWLYAPPINGMWESTMAGADAYWINGPVQAGGGERVFALMGFNYERGVAEALHSYGHRVESTLAHVYAGMPGNNAWKQFTTLDQDSPGHGGVGNVHYPVNGLSDYDYDNRRVVVSGASDWYNYATGLTGKTTLVSSSTWSPTHGDPQRDYLLWWYDHIPHFAGNGRDGKLANWWRYVGDLDTYK